MVNNIVSLLSVCDFKGGSQPPKSEWIKEEKEGYVRMLQIRDFTQGRAEFEYVKIKKKMNFCSEEDILIARYGASIGKIVSGLSGTYNVALIKAIPDESKLLKKYLYYFLKSNIFQHFIHNVGSRAAQAGFNKEDLKNVNLYLPTLTEQEKIIELLDLTNSIIQKRQSQIAALDKLTQNVFIKMFGENKNLTKVTIADVVDSIEAGWSVSGEERKKEKSEIAVLKISTVTKGYFKDDEYKVLSPNTEIKKAVYPKKGDIIFSRANTRELVGASAIVPKDYEDLILPDKLWKINLNKEIITPEYFYTVINTKRIRNQFSKNATGTSGSMLNISMQKFKQIEIYLPSIERQQVFSVRVNQIKNMKQKLIDSNQEINILYNSILQKAFNGELF
ncbi:restriction endonuclease subunit S [Bacillus sp. ISL-57]|uniref:restriction endonuclease subunit S n=1 Tax=Bacillus sp. ISL-57 TaxID=2819135 RepID=UPI001BEB2F4B|nr:restriction endonuclease subunit S [Bacillus sp. ISL-57]MBT2716972.1 restriction endonuclease subunit S [Bacillus sp. ISL-57]